MRQGWQVVCWYPPPISPDPPSVPPIPHAVASREDVTHNKARDPFKISVLKCQDTLIYWHLLYGSFNTAKMVSVSATSLRGQNIEKKKTVNQCLKVWCKKKIHFNLVVEQFEHTFIYCAFGTTLHSTIVLQCKDPSRLHTYSAHIYLHLLQFTTTTKIFSL